MTQERGWFCDEFTLLLGGRSVAGSQEAVKRSAHLSQRVSRVGEEKCMLGPSLLFERRDEEVTHPGWCESACLRQTHTDRHTLARSVHRPWRAIHPARAPATLPPAGRPGGRMLLREDLWCRQAPHPACPSPVALHAGSGGCRVVVGDVQRPSSSCAAACTSPSSTIAGLRAWLCGAGPWAHARICLCAG